MNPLVALGTDTCCVGSCSAIVSRLRSQLRMDRCYSVELSGPLRRVGQTEKGLLKAAATGMDLAKLATSR